MKLSIFSTGRCAVRHYVIPTFAFLIAVWLAARASMKLIPMILIGYGVWAIGAAILYLLRDILGLK
jgi:uncharacterized membrane protein (GlpM family)